MMKPKINYLLFLSLFLSLGMYSCSEQKSAEDIVDAEEILDPDMDGKPDVYLLEDVSVTDAGTERRGLSVWYYDHARPIRSFPNAELFRIREDSYETYGLTANTVSAFLVTVTGGEQELYILEALVPEGHRLYRQFVETDGEEDGFKEIFPEILGHWVTDGDKGINSIRLDGFLAYYEAKPDGVPYKYSNNQLIIYGDPKRTFDVVSLETNSMQLVNNKEETIDYRRERPHTNKIAF